VFENIVLRIILRSKRKEFTEVWKTNRKKNSEREGLLDIKHWHLSVTPQRLLSNGHLTGHVTCHKAQLWELIDMRMASFSLALRSINCVSAV
jgi:hypothetical protein